MIRSLWHFIWSKKYRPIITSALIVVSTGTIIFHFLEKWSWLDAFYFSVITLATVGYGDLTPKTDLGKFFTIIYIISGIGIFLAFIQSYFDFIRESKKA